jgi:hypothetical protein
LLFWPELRFTAHPHAEPSTDPSRDARSIKACTEIQALTERIVDRWNARDVDGYMEQTWKSDEFRIVVLDEEAFTVTGRSYMLQDYEQGYTDRSKMGNMRCQFPTVPRAGFLKADADRKQTMPISLSITPNGES